MACGDVRFYGFYCPDSSFGILFFEKRHTLKTTGIFTVHSYTIFVKRYGDSIYIIPFGDIHFNSPACDKHKFFSWCKEVNKENHYYIGMGDYLETVSTSERRILNCSDWHDSSFTRIMRGIEGDIQDFCEAISFMKGRIIGIANGNHYVDMPSGGTSDNKICEIMGAKFLGVSSLVEIIIKVGNIHSHRIVLAIHHGEGGGRTVGSSMNKLQRMANNYDADIILQGHDHNRAVDYINRLGITRSYDGECSLQNKRILLGRTGSFLKGYVENEPSYIVDGNLPPCDLGALKICIKPMRENKKDEKKQKRVDNRWIDITAEI